MPDPIRSRLFLLKLQGFFPLPRLLLIANVFLAFVLVWLLGATIARVIEYEFLDVPYKPPQPVRGAERTVDRQSDFSEFKSIIDFNVFEAEVAQEKIATQQPSSASTQAGENLHQMVKDYQLVGIIVSPGSFQYAIIRDQKKNREDIFSVKDNLFDTEAVLAKIIADSAEKAVHVTLGDQVAVLEYQQEEDAPQAADRPRPQSRPSSPSRSSSAVTQQSEYTTDGIHYHISSGEVDAHLNNFAQLLNQARMVPYFRSGQHKGYLVKAIDKGSLYEKLGLQNNDIIEEINGEPLDSMEKVMGLFKKLRTEREFTVKINRDGTSRFQNYYIN